MAAESIVDILDRCLSEIEAGATVAECLARYSEYRHELEPLLGIATGMAAFSAEPDPERKAAARDRFLDALETAVEPEVARQGRPASIPRRDELTAAREFADVLDTCLDAVLAGRMSIEECLVRYGPHRAELEPLLRVAQRISPLTLQPDPQRKLVARARFIEALYAEPEKRGLRAWVAAFFDQAASFRLGVRGAAPIVVGLALVTGGSAVYASEQALPGAPLYPVKLAVEQVWVATAFDEESRLDVQLEIASRRLAEVDRAASLGDANAVEAAASAYAATLQVAEEQLQRASGRGDGRAAGRTEQQLTEHQRALATAVVAAPPAAREAVERARGQAARGTERAGLVSGNGPASATTGSSSQSSAADPAGPATTGASPTSAGAAASTTMPASPTTAASATTAPTRTPGPTAEPARTPEPEPTAVVRVPSVVPTTPPAPSPIAPVVVPVTGGPGGGESGSPGRGRDQEQDDQRPPASDDDNRGQGRDARDDNARERDDSTQPAQPRNDNQNRGRDDDDDQPGRGRSDGPSRGPDVAPTAQVDQRAATTPGLPTSVPAPTVPSAPTAVPVPTVRTAPTTGVSQPTVPAVPTTPPVDIRPGSSTGRGNENAGQPSQGRQDQPSNRGDDNRNDNSRGNQGAGSGSNSGGGSQANGRGNER